ncbi:RNA polymerase sigma factor [Actinomadura decatromicini]|uniref:Sigma-70 family RNA polymerase sigma factor n=1 Tax=Actinomadura decatromicini TaxID=2604572 RepID=A0A5D3F7X6_9ACTN|nr:sigma-70 family RNA polymerase sigma factor [Actinomadura decatromicini]TYK44014.1 sigma-70 family RNA polymerase sigma factor [Actinomadura decatromicini]
MSDEHDREAARRRVPDPAADGADVRAALAATRRSFLDFFDAEFSSVVRFVMRDGAGVHDAQDSAQHAFVQGWRMAREGRWDQIDQPRAWIRTVALRHHRARDRVEIPVRHMPETAVPGAGHAELTGQARDLVAALRLLDHNTRMVLALHLDDIPTQAISAHLSISEQRVRDLLKRARRTLRKHLTAPPGRPPRPADSTEPAGHEGRHGQ